MKVEDYIKQLEDENEELVDVVLKLKSKLRHNKEIELKQLVSEILISIDDLFEKQEYSDRKFEGYSDIDFKDKMKNLQTYIRKYLEDNHISTC